MGALDDMMQLKPKVDGPQMDPPLVRYSPWALTGRKTDTVLM